MNTVHVYGQEKMIILKDVNILNVQDALTPAQIQCDAAALVYDASNSRSFEYIARIYIVSQFYEHKKHFELEKDASLVHLNLTKFGAREP